ncbi:MAG: DUF47 domain-containing protein [Coriobacteriales bacterium]
MARKPKFDYFDHFVLISDCAVEYAEALLAYMEKNAAIAAEGREPDITHAIQRYKELHEIEERSDSYRHAVAENLVNEFLAPLEREDIMVMADELDDLVDELEEVLQRMYMYDVHVVNPTVIDMMRLAHKATLSINALCKQFHNFKKHALIREHIVAVNDVEEEADRLYIEAMHQGFAHAKAVGMTSIDALGQAELLTALEEVCDMCEDIASTIATIMMKNS